MNIFRFIRISTEIVKEKFYPLMKSLIKTLTIAFEMLRSAVMIVVRFVAWCFTNKYSATVFTIIVVAAFSWGAGFLLFVNDIQETRGEMISDVPDFNSRTDAIVVVTGGSERIRHAIYLLGSGYAGKLFVSGVNKEVKLHELLILHGYDKVQQQLLSDRIELGYSAVDTIQNAHEIAEWVKKNNIKSIRLVTSNYHLKRALLELKHELPDAVIIPHGVVPMNIRVDRWWAYEPTRTLLVAEYNKYLLANLRIVLMNFGL